MDKKKSVLINMTWFVRALGLDIVIIINKDKTLVFCFLNPTKIIRLT
jgi:hypothetical protein